MKLRKIALTNVGCFLHRQELLLDGEMAILIGPNGGGKTTLVDAAIRALRKYLLVVRFANVSGDTDAPIFSNWETASEIQNAGFEKHWAGSLLPQKIELDVEVTQSDLTNIQTIKADLPEIMARSPQKLQNVPLGAPQEWSFEKLPVGTIFHYEIVDLALQGMTSDAVMFAAYLQFFDVHRQIRQAYGLDQLPPPIVYFPVTRHQGIDPHVTLSNSAYSQARRQSEVAAAKSSNAGLFELALQILGERALQLHHQYHVDPIEAIRKERGPALLTDVLHSFGFTWALHCSDRRKNTWGIDFKKDGEAFHVHTASTGEAEIIYYAVSITILDIRDTLVAIDEPEVHLHPRAQRQLLNLFRKLNAVTNNQFLFATHSPLFVTPESIKHVTRVASKNGESVVTPIDPKGIPDGKKAFDLINALNNEKIFFAEKVILVEGSSDEIFFSALFKKLGYLERKDIEIVRVGGKHNFSTYQALLEASNLPYAVIADLDYLREIGSVEIAQLFSLRAARIKKCVDNVDASLDGRALVEAIRRTIDTGDITNLNSVWTYLSGRHTELTQPLAAADQALVDQFITAQRARGIHVLRRGDLEKYLPDGFRSKDISKLIQLVGSADFLEKLAPEALNELREIGVAASV